MAFRMNPITAGAVAGGLGGATIGGLAGGLPKNVVSDGHIKKRTPGQRMRGAAGGAFLGGSLGTVYGAGFGARRMGMPPGGGAPFRRTPPPPDWLKSVKTRGEAKQKFRDLARAHHPDRGGDAEKMKTINAEYESWQKHHSGKLKNAMVNALFDEIQKIYGQGRDR